MKTITSAIGGLFKTVIKSPVTRQVAVSGATRIAKSPAAKQLATQAIGSKLTKEMAELGNRVLSSGIGTARITNKMADNVLRALGGSATKGMLPDSLRLLSKMAANRKIILATGAGFVTLLATAAVIPLVLISEMNLKQEEIETFEKELLKELHAINNHEYDKKTDYQQIQEKNWFEQNWWLVLVIIILFIILSAIMFILLKKPTDQFGSTFYFY